MSEPTQSAATTEDSPKLQLPLLPPLVFGIPYAAGIGLHYLLFMPPGFGLARENARGNGPGNVLENALGNALGGALLATALVLLAWTYRSLQRYGEHPHPGKPTRTLVVNGAFRLSRNPFYLAFVLSAAGIASMLQSLTALAAVPVSAAILQQVVIRREEKYLEALFQEPYRQYKRQVRRWL